MMELGLEGPGQALDHCRAFQGGGFKEKSDRLWYFSKHS